MELTDYRPILEASLAWWGSLADERRLEAVGGDFPLLFSYNSGKIENEQITFHDTREVFDKGRVVSFTGDLRTLYEIGNLKDAWKKTLGLLDASAPLDEPALLDLHRTLTKGTYDEERWSKGERPGTYKIADYVAAGDVGYPPSDVGAAVRGLLEELAGYYPSSGERPVNIFTSSCYAHAMIAEIHPFSDGNGRTARLVQNLILLGGGLPPIIIDERDRMSYFGALDAFHSDGELDPFRYFCAASMFKTWERRIGSHAEDAALRRRPHSIAPTTLEIKSALGDSFNGQGGRGRADVPSHDGFGIRRP